MSPQIETTPSDDQQPAFSSARPASTQPGSPRTAGSAWSRWMRGRLEHAKRVNPWLSLIIVAHVIATRGVLNGRYPVTHSFAPNVIWSFEWASQVKQGILYPHWMEHAFAGLGHPTFHFYAPLSLFMVLPFTVLFKTGLTQGVLLSTQLALLVMGFGTARLTKDLCGPSNRWLAGTIGALAVLAPYPLLDAYARGAMAEAWAMGIIPWHLSSLLRSLESRDLISRYPLVATTTLLGICHPPSFLIVTSTLGFCALITSFSWREVFTWAKRVFIPMLVGIGLGAFYLASAILDQKYARIDLINNDITGTPTYRMLATELGRLSTKMSEGFEGDMVPGFAAGALAVVLAIYLLVRWGHPHGNSSAKPVVFLIATTVLSVLMMTDLGRGVYALLPVFNRVQFAWRWLTLYTIVSTVIWGFVLLMVSNPDRLGFGFLRMFVWIATLWMATQSQWTIAHMVDGQTSFAQRVDLLFDKLARTGTLGDAGLPRKEINGGLLYVDQNENVLYLDVHEYLPNGAPEGFPPRSYARVEWASGAGKITPVEWRDLYRAFDIDSPEGGRILLRTRAWLGWEVNVNGTASPGDSMGDGGRMAILVPKGHSRIIVRYAGTPNQHWGNWVSLVFAIALLATYGWLKRHPDAHVRWAT